MKIKYCDRQASLFDDLMVIESPPQEVAQVTQVQEAVAQVIAPVRKRRELFVLHDEMLSHLNTEGAKVKANIAAIETLKRVTMPGTPMATAEEKQVLAGFSGWGGLSSVFTKNGPHEWAQERLKTLLTPDEYASAQESVLSAYYTEPEVIRAMWQMVKSLGFEGGRVIEPSCGPGHFIGCMPEEMRQDSRAVMVEIDSITAEIAEQCYADKQTIVHPVGLESLSYSSSFDLVIGNVPFGNYRVSDKRLDRLKLNIHNYFIAKSIDMVRPGGLVAVITSAASLESGGSSFLEYVQSKAELKMAVRLPAGAFGRLGGTDVVADILVLQRRVSSLTEEELAKEESLSEKAMPQRIHCEAQLPHISTAHVSKHFVDRPERVMGKFAWGSNRWGGCITVKPHADWLDRLKQIANHGMPSVCFDGSLNVDAQQSREQKSDPSGVKSFVATGFFFTEDGRLMQIDERNKVLDLENLSATAIRRLESMTRIRDCALKLLEADSIKSQKANHYRQELNGLYDGFVRQYGYLMDGTNRRLFRADSHAPLLWSLEVYDDELETAKKADIFTSSTVSDAVLSATAESVEDAIALSYNRFGKIDIGWIAGAMSASYDDVVDELVRKDRVFMDPESGQWVDALEYLSGEVRKKHILATAAARGDSMYERNVRELEKVLPPIVDLSQVALRLGVPWIGAEYVEQWLTQTFQIGNRSGGSSFSYCAVTVTQLTETASWVINFNNPKHELFKTEWGTSRKHFWDILATLLNQQTPEVYDIIELEGGKEKRVINKDETLAVQEKALKIQEAFSKWVMADASRVSELQEKYNLLFNGRVNRAYDGSHLVVPGLNPQVKLRDAQKDSIWRGLVNGNTLWALAVGGGKTLIQICVAQESKRLGIAAKPMLVVPNHMLEAFASEYLRAFPRAKVLAASKDDLQGDSRRALLMRMATNEWDCIIVTHSTFGRIGLDDEVIEDFIGQVKRQAQEAVLGVTDKNVIREASRAGKQVETKLKGLMSGEKDKGIPGFEKLGVDMVLVDEADLFKNLFFFTKKKRIPGIAGAFSSRALDLFIKSRVIFGKRGDDGFGLHFSTATPISNSIGEMFIMQTYLQEQRLQSLDISNFDAWAANFAREVTCVEVKPEGSGYRMHTRFASFVNVPELMLIFREVAEIRTKKQLALPEPELVGGGHNVIAVRPSEAQRAYVEKLVLRAEAIRDGKVTPDVDNMLWVTGDGRKAALDMRIIDPTLPDHEGSKVNECIRRVFQFWEEGKEQRHTQLIFSDLSVPGGVFSVYEHIKSSLMAMGVPEDEIAFAQDYSTDKKKAELHRKVRSGRIRVLIGSTELMGFGTNVQDRLVAKHDLDAPWRPRDVEQRDGRIIRQGNLNEEVHILRYVTEQTFDAYSWQTLERKAGFIAQVMENNGAARSVEDVTTQALSYAEVKALASGNPMVIEKAGVDAEVARLQAIKSVFLSDSRRRKSTLYGAQQDLRYVEESIAKAIAWKANLQIDVGSFNVGGRVHTSALQTGEAIMKRMAMIREAMRQSKSFLDTKSWDLFTIGNVKVRIDSERQEPVFRATQDGDSFVLRLREIPYGAEKLAGYLTDGSLLREVDDRIKMNTLSKEKLVDEILTLEKAQTAVFEHEEKLVQLLERQAEINLALEIDVDDRSAMALETEEG